MELIDTHSHLYDEAFDTDFIEVVSRARDAGVVSLVFPGIDRASYDRLVRCTDSMPDFAYPGIGLHPTSVGSDWREELQFVFDRFSDRQWFAVGEIGLDCHWSDEFIKEQIEVLESQLELASVHELPVIIHLRDATEEFFHVLEDMKGVPISGTMHAYSGSYETYCRLLRYADFKFGIGGVVTYKNAGVADSLQKMSMDDLVLETDCPWLTPVPHRGSRNESSYVRLVAEKVSIIKGISVEEVASITTRNARNLFKIKQ